MTTVGPIEWRQCALLPDHEVSEYGDLRRKANSDSVHQSGRLIYGVINADGYITYTIRSDKVACGSKRYTAHRLVIETFVGPAPDDGGAYEVAHNNGSRMHNHYSNLRWATRQENSDDRLLHDTSAAGINNGRVTITEDDVHYIRRRYRELKMCRKSPAELDEQFGLCRGQIIRIAKGDAWSHVPWLEQDYGYQ
jgi:hypothetical protein